MTKDGYQKITTGEDTGKDGFISLLLFQWMDNIFKTGSTGTIEESDFAPLLRENSTASYSKRLQTQWEKERAKSKGNGKRPKLWKSVITMISINEALIMVLPRALYGLWRLLKPLLLGYLHTFIDLIFAAYGARCIGDNKRTTELFTQRGMIDYFNFV